MDDGLALLKADLARLLEEHRREYGPREAEAARKRERVARWFDSGWGRALRDIGVQAAGTALGAGLIVSFGFVSGLLESPNQASTIVGWIVLVIGVLSAVLTFATSFGQPQITREDVSRVEEIDEIRRAIKRTESLIAERDARHQNEPGGQ